MMRLKSYKLSKMLSVFACKLNQTWLLLILASILSLSSAQASDAGDVSQWSGVWEREGSFNFDPNIPFPTKDKPPYTPEFQAKFEEVIAAEQAGRPIDDPGSMCLPRGVVMMMMAVYPMEITAISNQLTIVNEYLTQVRRVYLDGRPIPDDLDKTFNGYSIGHWDGDVLIVETFGLRDTLSLTQGTPLGPDLQMTERMYLEDADTFVNEITLTGLAFTKPWSAKRVYKRAPHIEMMEYICENNRNPRSSNGVTGVILQTDGNETEVFID